MEKSFAQNSQKAPTMPDVASQLSPSVEGCIDHVGMGSVEVPVFISEEGQAPLHCSAKADAFVSLDDPKAKGIHMSRLYLQLCENLESAPLNFSLLEKTAVSFIESHAGLSNSASLKVAFDYMLSRKALLSENSGWRTYPSWMKVEVNNSLETKYSLGVRVTYSSTCPCSAALARQLIQEKFNKDFASKDTLSKSEVDAWLLKEESICATPHSQRSFADVEIRLKSNTKNFPTVKEFIDRVESSLQTAVQAAVKREDEQEFARLNGKNLMFCEDAARKMRVALESDPRIEGYKIRAEHVESLHPHNAISIIEK